MVKDLRSVLGLPRVKKRSSNKTKASSTPSPAPSSSSSLSASWTKSLPRTKLGGSLGTGTVAKASQHEKATKGNDSDDTTFINHEKGAKTALKNGFTTFTRLPIPETLLQNIPQAHAYIRARMFDPVPERSSGMNSTKIAAVLRFRAALPPVVSAAHIQSLLVAVRGRKTSPTAVEREMAELVQAGKVRRVMVPRRGAVGELVILAEDLKGLVERAAESGGDGKEEGVGGGLLDQRTKSLFLKWLRDNPAAQTMPKPSPQAGSTGEEMLQPKQIDALVRAGFLTDLHDGRVVGRGTGVYARPEDLYTMLSLETVSQAAAGSLAAVGGEGVLHEAGGTGARTAHISMGGKTTGHDGHPGRFQVAVPGAGAFLKLVSVALDHLAALLERGNNAKYREMPEADLLEKWDGGILGVDKEAALAKKSRGEFVGVLPGRAKKWRDFSGLSFDWVLQEALGDGLVEVFETGSVGRGVRLVDLG